MPTPAAIRFWKKKAVLFKPEVTYKTDPVPTGTNNWFDARNVSLVPADFDFEERGNTRINMGNSAKVITGKRMKLVFDVPLATDGPAGTAPKLAPMLRACGWSENISAGVSVAYALISTAFESGTFYLNIDGVLHKGIGARGSVGVKLDKGIPLLHVELTALYLAPTDTAMPATTRTGWPAELPVNAANTLTVTLNAVNSWYTKCELTQGNEVVHDDLPGGYEAIVIKDRAPSMAMSILAPTLAVFNPFSLMEAQTNIAIQVVHGAVAGAKVRLDVKATITGVTYEELNGKVGYALTLHPEDPTDLNTEITLTFL